MYVCVYVCMCVCMCVFVYAWFRGNVMLFFEVDAFVVVKLILLSI